MRAIVINADGSLSLGHRPKPAAGDECLIRVLAAGICGTDLELLRGYAGFAGVPGHEFIGRLEQFAQAVERAKRGLGLFAARPRHGALRSNRRR